jgi:hypothetical protein
MIKWITDFLSGDNDKSSKRLVFLLSSTAYIVQHFLLMYIKIEIANANLVDDSRQGLFWLAACSGSLVAMEKFGISFSKKSDPPQNPSPQ